jgi:hypothetical protein
MRATVVILTWFGISSDRHVDRVQWASFVVALRIDLRWNLKLIRIMTRSRRPHLPSSQQPTHHEYNIVTHHEDERPRQTYA